VVVVEQGRAYLVGHAMSSLRGTAFVIVWQPDLLALTTC
jgi:hypothetical protein